MNLRLATVGLFLTTLLAGSPTASADDAAAKSAARAADLIKQGDLDGALDAYAAAARADGDNEQYRQQYMLLRRVMKMRTAILKETNEQKWWQMAVSLRSYYYQHELYNEVLTLAKQMHAKKSSPGSATVLGDAYLAVSQNVEAEKALSAVDAKELSPQGKVLLGIALARQKKLDEAKGILKGIEIPKEKVSPRFLLDVARLKILCGDADGAGATLTTAFENTAPSALPGFKTCAKKTPEVGPLAGSATFAKAFAAESKVPESSCSGGSSCGTCPNRGSCAGSSGGQSCAESSK
ncbi:MAG: hypothetical protein JXQ73_09310 [Phycisphaerae bacterium]|nr:hypothetical protein [Phycisphaerae bacterium]